MPNSTKKSKTSKVWDFLSNMLTIVRRTCVEFASFVYFLFEAAFRSIKEYKNEVIIFVFVVLSLLLLQFSIYFAVTGAFIVFLFAAHEHFKTNLAKLDAKKDQAEIKEDIEKLQGFEAVSTEFLEFLSRSVYDFFSQDHNFVINNATKTALYQKGFSDLKEVGQGSGLRESGIKMATTISEKHKSLVVITSGTDSDELGNTFVNDFDDMCPGHTVFMSNKKTIVNEILKSVKDNDIEHINLSGHSFGGSISMLLANALLEKKANGELDNVSTINVSIYQSAGVDSSVNEAVKTNLNTLNETHSDFRLNVVVHHHDMDLVPGSGYQILGDYDGKNANVFLVRRHLTIRSFIEAVFTYSLFTLPHLTYIYESTKAIFKGKNGGIKNESFKLEYYRNNKEGGHNKDIKKMFCSAHTKFICNGTLYRFLKRYSPQIWRGVKILSVLIVLAAGFVINAYFFFAIPAFVSFLNIFRSVLPVVEQAEIYKDHYARSSELSKKEASHTPNLTACIGDFSCSSLGIGL